MMLWFVCEQGNDLYQTAQDCGVDGKQIASLSEAITAAQPGDGVLALADGYPRADLVVDADLLERGAEKGLRCYLEYPRRLAGLTLGDPTPIQWERGVVQGDFFAPALEDGRILAIHGAWYLPASVDAPHLVLARVAGYDTAVFGLPPEAHPVLFNLSENVLVAATKLSQFVTARYGPTAAWQAFWQRLLAWLSPGAPLPALRWTPTIQTQSAGAAEPLSADAEAAALRRSVKWFREQALFSIGEKKGAIEGYESAIDHYGRQRPRTWARGDCIGESTLPFIYDYVLHDDPFSRRVASELLDYVCFDPAFYHQDPTSPTFGLGQWALDSPVFYGQENASILLPALVAGQAFDDPRWDERVVQYLLANFRTTGALGFRRDAIRVDQFPSEPDGWQVFFQEEHISYAPHYQASLWASFLWAYALTGYEPFLARTRTAIHMTMAAYPQAWHWTNGMTQEQARMLLPLAFLVRVEDTAQHRRWLRRVADDLLAFMQPSGAIYERFGDLATGKYPPPQRNEDYGTNEASLIQRNGDPCCDLLYTANFALLGLHEAAGATGDPVLVKAEDRLASLLCRVQVRSDAHPYLDGAWLRGFDDQLWEYWGSSSDAGWGAWCVESGWTNAWIAAVLGMRLSGRCLWDLQRAEHLAPLLAAYLPKMGMD